MIFGHFSLFISQWPFVVIKGLSWSGWAEGEGRQSDGSGERGSDQRALPVVDRKSTL